MQAERGPSVSGGDDLAAAGAAAVVGFDAVRRRWITQAEAAEAAEAPFDRVPPLEGRLLTDAAARAADATDGGNTVFMSPAVVLQPGSVADVARMIEFCGARGVRVATRGHAHTTFGQGLSDGLVIENAWLDRIHAIDPVGKLAVVDAGSSWKQLVTTAFTAHKLTPPVLTGYVGLTIGGTLSVGGIGGLVGGLDTGLQVDHVTELEVVTGDARVVSCSAGTNADLFDGMLGGLGQCGVMTKATIQLRAAHDRARTYHYQYTDTGLLFADFRRLLANHQALGIGHLYTLWLPVGPAGSTGRLADLQAAVFYDAPGAPDDAAFAAAASVPPVIEDVDYLTYVQQVDTLVEQFRQAASWDALVKPWYDVWLPDTPASETFVGDVVAALTPDDVGPTGFLLLIPQRRAALTRPFTITPTEGTSEWVLLFDILTASATPAPGDAYVRAMTARNRSLFDRAAAIGGVRYPIGTIPFGVADWERHYGTRYRAFQDLKRRYDPNGIMTPGPGIFPSA